VLLKAKEDFTAAGGVLANPVKDKKGGKKEEPAKKADAPKKEAPKKEAKPVAAAPAAPAKFAGSVTVYPAASAAVKIAAGIAALKTSTEAPPAATSGAPAPAGSPAVLTADGVVTGVSTVLSYCCNQSELLAPASALETGLVRQWLSFKASPESAKDLDASLLRRTYLGGNHLTAADLAVYEAVHGFVSSGKAKSLTNLLRWFEHVQNQTGVKGGLATVEFGTKFFVPKVVAGSAPAPKKEAGAAKGAAKGAPATKDAPPVGGDGKPQMSEKQAAKKAAKEAEKAKKAADKAAGGDTKPAKAAAPAAGKDWNVSHLKIVVGTIIKAWPHPDSDKLWCEEIDCGEESTRQIASGLRAYYPDDLGCPRKVLVLANLKPKKLGGFPSNGMVLCASSADKSKTIFAEVPAGAKNGEQVTFEGFEGEPATPAQMDKKKVFETVAPMLVVADDGTCTGAGAKFMTSAGPCMAPGMGGSHIA